VTTAAEVIERGAPFTLECLRKILSGGRKVPRQDLNPEPIILRTLEVAIHMAVLEAAQAPKDSERWALISKSAAATARHLESFLLLLGQEDSPAEIIIAQLRAHRDRSTDPWKGPSRDAKILSRTRSILLDLAADAERRRKSFMDKPHRVHPDINAFVRIFAEGWTFLFGRRPPTTPDNHGPFIRLVTAGMKDWLGTKAVDKLSNNEDGYWLAQALKLALQGLPKRLSAEVRPWQKPSWL
jgi:hypothetical protein